jgi:hypothetical protein
VSAMTCRVQGDNSLLAEITFIATFTQRFFAR